MSQEEMNRLWDAYLDMTMETMTGKRKPKLYEYEREAIDKLKERYNG